MKSALCLALMGLLGAMATSPGWAAEAPRAEDHQCRRPLTANELGQVVVEMMPPLGRSFSDEEIGDAIQRYNRTHLRKIEPLDRSTVYCPNRGGMFVSIDAQGSVTLMGIIPEDLCVSRSSACRPSKDIQKWLTSPRWKLKEVCFTGAVESSHRVMLAEAAGRQSIPIVGIHSEGFGGGGSWLELHPLRDQSGLCAPILPLR